MDINHELWIKSFKVDFDAIKKLLEEAPEKTIEQLKGKITKFIILGSIETKDLIMKIMVEVLDENEKLLSITDNIRLFSEKDWIASSSYYKLTQLCKVADVPIKGTTPEQLRDLLQYREVSVILRKSEKGIFIGEYK